MGHRVPKSERIGRNWGRQLTGREPKQEIRHGQHTILGTASDIVGVAGALFAFAAWVKIRATRDDLERERQRQAQPINVVLALSTNGKMRSLPVRLQRRELTRAELLGRLGMLPMREPGKRFSLAYLTAPGFLAQLQRAQESSGEFVFEIPCSDAEFEQFA